MIIKSATFVTSAVKPAQYPQTGAPEIAFAGRSNVGKSSLINTLINRRNLVKTSSTPGKTRLINFFAINERFLFVDLPGYGYAKVSKSERSLWGPMVESYLTVRENLKGVIILQDIRREPGKEELDLVDFLHHIRLPFFFIFTKADKLSKNKQVSRVKQVRQQLSLAEAEFVIFSAKTGQGKDRTWQQIARMFDFPPNGAQEKTQKTDLSGDGQADDGRLDKKQETP